jgi:hypothetical protein
VKAERYSTYGFDRTLLFIFLGKIADERLLATNWDRVGTKTP